MLVQDTIASGTIKLVLGIVQRAVSNMCHGYRFEGASGGTPSLFYADV